MLAYAGGAVLTMLADTMMPDAFEHGGPLVGVVTTVGFGVGFFANANHMASLLLISLPFIAALDATPAFILLAGIYIGAQYGGATSAITTLVEMKMPGPNRIRSWAIPVQNGSVIGMELRLMSSDNPRARNMPASVTMKLGTLSRVVSSPITPMPSATTG